MFNRLLGIIFVSVWISAIFSSRPIEMFGCRSLGVIGSFVFCLGIALTSLAPSLNVVYITFGIIAGLINYVLGYLKELRVLI